MTLEVRGKWRIKERIRKSDNRRGRMRMYDKWKTEGETKRKREKERQLGWVREKRERVRDCIPVE